MVSEETKETIEEIQNLIKQYGIQFQYLEDLLNISDFILNREKDTEYGLKITNYVKKWCSYCIENNIQTEDMDRLYWETLRKEGPWLFDSFLIYLEKDREPHERFYMPRRKQLMKLGLIQALQDIEDDKYDILTISLAPGTGKTTLEKFFTAWIIGRHPEKYNLFYSHSDGITRMFYDGILEIASNPEYLYYEIFPNLKLTKTDAKAQQITFNKYKPFPNLQTGTIDSNLAGKVRANGYLLCDDLIGKMEQALNKTYLQKLWEVKYAGDAKQRKMTGCKEIHIATRWSTFDIIARIMNLMAKNPRAKFISVDCYDENGESNFDYDYGVGLSTEFLHEQEKFMDDISFKCLYRNQPIEREGRLYTEEELRRYYSLPDREPDAILGVCDTKSKGTDYYVLPCFYQYDDDFYLVDCICNNDSDYGVQYERTVDIIIRNNMQQCQIESNQGGTRVAYEVSKLLKEKGSRCNITEKTTSSNKETKIIVNADWVKKHVLFKDESLYTAKEDYGIFMSFLVSYSIMAGLKQKDDVPDAMAMFALYVSAKYRIKKSIIIGSPI